MVFISTIILIANLVALVWKGTPFMSFWFNVLAYLIEIIIYLIIVIVCAVISWKASE